MTAVRTTLNEPGGHSQPVTPTPEVPRSNADDAVRYLGEQVNALDAGKQDVDALLTSISGLTFGANSFIYGTGTDTAAVGTVTAFARSCMAAADEAAFKQLVNLESGVDVQAYDADLAAIAGLTSAENKVPYFTGSGTAALADFSTFGRLLVDDADASAARTTLGLGSMATQNANDVAITGGSVAGITDLAVADGGTGASTAAQAATNLGLGTGDSPQFAGINLGHASDTTITRTGAGDIAIEGNAVYRASGTDVPIADGGTGASSAATARTNLGVGAALLASGTVSNAAALDIVLSSYTGYRAIKIVTDLLPATNGVELYARFSTDGGSSYDATGYAYANHYITDGGYYDIDYSATASQIILAFSIGNASTSGAHIDFEIMKQTSVSMYPRCKFIVCSLSDYGSFEYINGGGVRKAAQDTDAIRLLFSSGNIASGTYAVYGLL